VIPTNIYGAHDNYSIQHGHVIPGLIHKAFIAKKTNTPFVIWGSGRPLRQFIHASDLAQLMVWVMKEYHHPTPIILSVDEKDEVSIHDIALIIAKAMKLDESQIVFDSTKADGQYKKTASNQKLRQYLPDYQFIDIQNGIQQAVDWFIANYDSAKK